MSEMIERVAKAIKSKVPQGYGMTDAEAEEYARAAIDAIREPTEAMEKAENKAPSRNEAHNVEGDYATTARQAKGPYRSFRSQPMTRFPYAGEAIKEKLAYIKKLQHSLAYFRSIPPHQRAAEHADEGEHDCITLLRAVGVESP